MSEHLAMYADLTIPELQTVREYLVAMIPEARDEAWEHGLKLQLGEVAYQLFLRGDDECH